MFNAQNAANQQYQDWTKMGTAAGQQDFQNWLTHASFPVGALGQMAQATAQIRPGSPAAISTQQGELTDADKAAMGIGALNTGIQDGSLDGVTNWLSNAWNSFGGNQTPSNTDYLATDANGTSIIP